MTSTAVASPSDDIVEDAEVTDVSPDTDELPEVENSELLNEEIVIPETLLLPPPPKESVDDWILDFKLETSEDFWFEAPDR